MNNEIAKTIYHKGVEMHIDCAGLHPQHVIDAILKIAREYRLDSSFIYKYDYRTSNPNVRLRREINQLSNQTAEWKYIEVLENQSGRHRVDHLKISVLKEKPIVGQKPYKSRLDMVVSANKPDTLGVDDNYYSSPELLKVELQFNITPAGLVPKVIEIEHGLSEVATNTALDINSKIIANLNLAVSSNLQLFAASS